MAAKINYPGVDNVTVDDWRVMIQDLEIFTGDILLIGVENINSTGAPRILINSLFDINGSRYKCTTTESMTNGATDDKQNYIYAVASGNTASFQYSAAEPQWDMAKGGWYSGNNRAIVRLFVTGGKYTNKVILDSYNAKYMINTQQDIAALAGIVGVPKAISDIFDSNNNYINDKTFVGSVKLDPGIYRYELKGSKGGKGGKAGVVAGQGHPANDGGDGGEGEALAGIFFHHGGVIRIKVGADGGNGGDGGAGDFHGVSGNMGGGVVFDEPGNGGNAGAGTDSILGGIVAKGGISGSGSWCWPSGQDGEPNTPAIGFTTKPGTPGTAPSNATSGYARLWQVG